VPSPIGHGLAAVAAGWGIAGLMAVGQARWRQIAILVAIGLAPDLDLLWGRHSRETHSVGAALIVATVAAWQRWPVASTRTRIWLAVCAAWLTHPMLDAMSSDTSIPVGIMAFWPLSTEFFTTGWDTFGPISRRYWLDNFWAINLTSIGRELVLLGPVAVAVSIYRTPGRSSGRAAQQPPSV
jgi:inner membrane protein